MRSLKSQFFITYAIPGSIMTLLPVVLEEEKGFTRSQVGSALALTSVAALFSPVVITLFADMSSDSRRVIAGTLGVATLVLLWLHAAAVAPLVFALVAIYGLALVATFPVQDGFYFAAARSIERRGEVPEAYPRIRVWGTVGFILPGILLWLAMGQGAAAGLSILVGAVFCLVGAVNAFRLPRLEPAQALGSAKSRLPSVEAVRALFSGDGIPFCLALALANMASSTYHGFVPLYLKTEVGIPNKWIPLVINFGVVLEVLYTLALPWMQDRIGVKRLFVFGFAVMAARMFALAFFPFPAVSVLAQTFHGIEVIAMFILPVIYLNRLAGDRFRSSIQGVFAMLVAGISKIVGYQIAGRIADHSLTTLFIYGGCLALIPMVIAIFFFRRMRDLGPDTEPEPIDGSADGGDAPPAVTTSTRPAWRGGDSPSGGG